MGLGRNRTWRNTPQSWHETTCRSCLAQFRTNTLQHTCPKCRAKHHRSRKK